MPMPNPPIAGPPYDDVAGRTDELAQRFCLPNWTSQDDEVDLGRALIRVFDRMARHVIERINRVPDRSLLAFLNLLGVEPLPPRPARAPLTFTLVERSSAEPIVPAGTRVGAAPASGDTREIVFETARELPMTRARLQAACVHVPGLDRWADRTKSATGLSRGYFWAFRAVAAVEHALYLAADDILSLPQGTSVTITLTFPTQADLTVWKTLGVVWFSWSGVAWDYLPTDGADVTATTWTSSFDIPANMPAVDVNGQAARWLRAWPTSWPQEKLPFIEGIQVSASVTCSDLAPHLALSGGRPVDLSMDFFPLGEQPRFNDTFYVACDEALSRPGASVTVTVTPSDHQETIVSAKAAPKLVWEVSTASGWALVAQRIASSQGTDGNKEIVNDVFQTETFTLPPNVAPAEVAGRRAHWLRVRLVSGDFGKGIEIIPPPAGSTDQSSTVINHGYQPPLLQALTFAYTLTVENPAPESLTYNDFSFQQVNGQGGGFAPFTRSSDVDPALYLGFDRPFANRETRFYLQVAPLVFEDADAEMSIGGAWPKVVWEYATPEGWAPLGAIDETSGFARSGLVQFIGPRDLTRRRELGRELYWIRARLAEGAYAVMPLLRRVLTNTVWATQAVTITNEILGSSDGGPRQTFTFAQRPVLEGQRLEVREPERPPAAERAAIEGLEGPEAIRIVGDPDRPEEIWVRWRQVPDFHASGPRDRHYTLDRRTGELRFGDGQRGMVPPRGVRSVRAAVYQSGGGADGNRPAGALSQLKTTIPYVDGVTNLEPATGGADHEPVEGVKRRGPRALRHQGRAVTVEDLEDLAREASPAVARAWAIPPRLDPFKLGDEEHRDAEFARAAAEAGRVILVIIPSSPTMPPMPSAGLLQDVEAFLRRRCPTALSLRLTGPAWIEVGVAITFAPVSLEGVEALRGRVARALADFLHPLTGGAEGVGWGFGQIPRESDIYRLVASIPGVDLVRAVALTFTDAIGEPIDPAEFEQIARAVVFPGVIDVHIAASEAS